MKKVILIFLGFFLLILAGYSFTQASDQKKSQGELTLKQAIDLAFPTASSWNENAKLIEVTSVDNEKSKLNGMEGKRGYWTVTFGIPNSNKLFLITIHKGKIHDHVDITNKYDTPRKRSYFVNDLSKIKYDTPKLLKKAKQTTKLYPGTVFAKGYNFGLVKDPDKNIILVKVIGWDKKREKMKTLFFNGTTGELYKN